MKTPPPQTRTNQASYRKIAAIAGKVLFVIFLSFIVLYALPFSDYLPVQSFFVNILPIKGDKRAKIIESLCDRAFAEEQRNGDWCYEWYAQPSDGEYRHNITQSEAANQKLCEVISEMISEDSSFCVDKTCVIPSNRRVLGRNIINYTDYTIIYDVISSTATVSNQSINFEESIRC